MQIQRDEHGRRGAFFIDEDGEWVAELSYINSGDNEITIDHTEVDEKLRDQGIGHDLVREAVNYARQNNKKIKATCPFARQVIEDTPEFQDVLAAKA